MTTTAYDQLGALTVALRSTMNSIGAARVTIGKPAPADTNLTNLHVGAVHLLFHDHSAYMDAVTCMNNTTSIGPNETFGLIATGQISVSVVATWREA